MQLIRGLHNLKAKHKGAFLTIGNFDGVHLGHQRLLKDLVEKSKINHCASIVMVFEPQPLEFFLKNEAPARLLNLRNKFYNISQFSIDYLLVIPFNLAFSSLSAEEFVKKILLEKLEIKGLILGNDFRFGKNKFGTIDFLIDLSKKSNFQLSILPKIYLENERISSTNLRKILQESKFNEAKKLIGKNYHLIGRVIYGKQLARMLGAPTANIDLKMQKSPLFGVYATKIKTRFGDFFGVSNVGFAPTVKTEKKLMLESHLFDFDGNLYGEIINIVFYEKIRNEKKFNSFEELKAQIAQDIFDARRFFENSNCKNKDENGKKHD